MSVQITDNSAEALAGLKRAKARALEIIGLKAEGYAKRLCPVGTVESTGKKEIIPTKTVVHSLDIFRFLV